MQTVTVTTSESNETKLIALTKELEVLKDAYKAKAKEVQALLEQFEEGAYLQDPIDKTVFKVIVPTGTFVEFRKIDYIRTRRTGEKRGELSLKEAKEAGFEVGEE